MIFSLESSVFWQLIFVLVSVFWYLCLVFFVFNVLAMFIRWFLRIFRV